jgi:4-oxalmesaconate hydratase
MIIDCHGHYTTAPAALQQFRDSQLAGLKNGVDVPLNAAAPISDDQIRDSLENAQLKLQRARGTDLTIFSPPWPITSATRQPACAGLMPAMT